MEGWVKEEGGCCYSLILAVCFISSLSVFCSSYLGLASFRFVGIGGFIPGVGGGSLEGNVARLVSTGGAIQERYVPLIIMDKIIYLLISKEEVILTCF